MNEHMTIGELFYCLIEDIEDYLMHVDNDNLEDIVQTLDAVKEKYDSQQLDKDDLIVLNIANQYFEDNEFKQFSEDLQEIRRRLQ